MSTYYKTITCGVPQDSILGPLLILNYGNNLHRVSASIILIMLADDTNLFYSSKKIRTLFKRMSLNLLRFLNG